MSKHFICMMRPGPNILSKQHDDLINQHCEYLQKLYEEDIVIFAGPSWEEGEDNFAVVVFESDSKESARAIMNGNPAVLAEVLTSNVTEFEIFLSKCIKE
jgi:uncharacterized protein YciI